MKLKKGDKVRIVRKIEEWPGNSWAPDMDRYVNDGKVYTVQFIDEFGVRLYEDNSYWAFPEGCFLLVGNDKMELIKNCLPKQVYEGETVVQVISPIGSVCGVFCWPTDQLSIFEQSNATPFGYYFAWRKDNDLSQPAEAHVPAGTKALPRAEDIEFVSATGGEAEVRFTGRL